MMGILGTQTLRASDISLLNDEKEYKLGIDLVKHYLSSRFLNDYFLENEHKKELYKKHIDAVVWQLDRWNYPRDFAFGKYVVSLSGAGDQLSQWRGYGNNGYAICFQYDKLEHDIKDNRELNGRKDNEVFELNRVNYVGSENDIIQIEKIKKIFECMAQMMEKGEDTNTIFSQSGLGDFLPIYPAYLKNKGFKEEAEYRILVGSNRQPSGYISTKLGPRAYIEVNFSRESVSKVVIAPGSNKDMRIFAAQRFLQGNGYDDALGMVDYSQLSFRG